MRVGFRFATALVRLPGCALCSSSVCLKASWCEVGYYFARNLVLSACTPRPKNFPSHGTASAKATAEPGYIKTPRLRDENHCLMIYEHCRDGFDRAPEHNVNDRAAVAVPIPHSARKQSAALPRTVRMQRASALRALVLASLCGLVAIPAHAVTSVASNLKVSVNGDKVVLSWTGTQAFCTRHEATRV